MQLGQNLAQRQVLGGRDHFPIDLQARLPGTWFSGKTDGPAFGGQDLQQAFGNHGHEIENRFLVEMRVRVKVQADAGWQPTLRMEKRWWVNLPDGRYFHVGVSPAGSWYNSFANGQDFPSQESAIKDGLIRLHNSSDGAARYRRLRVKERVFTIP
jgi:hypothetical protein